MRIVGIVQARMGSTRLPGKVLRELGDRSVLGWVVRAAREAGALDDLVVATTTEPADDAVVAECHRLGVACHRGPVDDVLTRFAQVLAGRRWDAVMRFTADCPLLDPEVVREAALVFRAVPGLDYLSTSLARTLPRGLDVELAGRAAFERAHAEAAGYHRTHVTSYLYEEPGQTRLLGLAYRPAADDLRVTLDTEDDWRLISAVVAELGDRCVPVRTLVSWLRERPEVCGLNAHVRQKALQDA
ncbi:cytidylyltransferase domain-containing protein [Nonomuraea gerenzanensis]|uniref:Acylneuraminate cytidylyltransferase n=1 Tax=Nonomuraea gerenzanensis TaxID=93944 RepID=A0A1M4E004_9ACTN|nr:NTP transferase domain-containing protein [Nonomuraea gerenzanensis]UBU14434.1 NTP transferase domain-containing protein [Nonomuraea gerenzanensis]SBO92149.1 Acylneuraminate cytidylyltransferase [Nonomuraea gerenzanensis]